MQYGTDSKKLPIDTQHYRTNEGSVEKELFTYLLIGLSMIKVSLYTSQVALQNGAYPGFCSTKRPGVFVPPFPRWMGW